MLRKSLGVLIILLLTRLSSPGAEFTRNDGKVVPGGWNPSLEQVDAYLQEEFATKKEKSQQALNRASQSRAELRDAQMFITYVRLAQSLDEQERSKLFDEQRQWLAAREKSARVAVVSRGGSLEPLEYSGAFRRITEKRLAELEKRLAQRRTKTPGNEGRKER